MTDQPGKDLFNLTADRVDQQTGRDAKAAASLPPAGPDTAILTTAEVRTLTKMLRRVLTPDQRASVAAELADNT